MPSQVLRYKVEKALKEGFKIERSVINTPTSWTYDPVYDQCISNLATLVGRPHERGDVERLVEELVPDPNMRIKISRTYATIDELVEYARPIYDRGGMDELEKWRYTAGGACGCMGPQGLDPLCPCEMRESLAKNIDDVKMRLAEEANCG